MDKIYNVQCEQNNNVSYLNVAFKTLEKAKNYLENDFDEMLVQGKDEKTYINAVQNPYYMEEEPTYTIIETKILD